MDPRRFRTQVEFCNNWWLGELLDIDATDKLGIDLSDKVIGVEVKNRYDKWEPYWAVHHYQLDEFRKQNPNKELFWAFLLYGLSKEPSEIKENDDVDEYVTSRNVWLAPWDLLRDEKKFPVSYPKTGPYIYVSKKKLEEQDLYKLRKANSEISVPKGFSSLVQRLALL